MEGAQHAHGGRRGQRVVTLAPGQTQRIETDVALSGKRSYALGASITNRLEYQVAPYGLSGAVEAPFVVKTVTAARGDYPQNASFALDQQTQVENRFEHDPYTIKMVWKGWGDKSGQARVARQGDDLKMRLQVLDDTPFSVANDITKGDSAIVSLQLPGQTAIWSWAVAEVEGKAVVQTLSAPQGQTANLAASVSIDDKKNRVFELRFPGAAIGLNDAAWRAGAKFNVLLVDNDGLPAGVENWISAAPGAKPDAFETSDWPVVMARNRKVVGVSFSPTHSIAQAHLPQRSIYAKNHSSPVLLCADFNDRRQRRAARSICCKPSRT